MMTAIEAATLYAGLFLLLFLALKVNVGRVRVGEKVNLGESRGVKDPDGAVRVEGGLDQPRQHLELLHKNGR